MAFAHPPVLSPVAGRAEQLARLAYELLDAHGDTLQLVREQPSELQWRAHLSYLRDLQRLGRELLAQDIETSIDCGATRFRPRERSPWSGAWRAV